MLGHHDAAVAQAGGPAGEPAAAVVEFEFGIHPFRGQVRRQERPELVEIPEQIPESVAAVDGGLGVLELLHAPPHVGVFTVRVAPDGARHVGVVKVGVELDALRFRPARHFDFA